MHDIEAELNSTLSAAWKHRAHTSFSSGLIAAEEPVLLLLLLLLAAPWPRRRFGGIARVLEGIGDQYVRSDSASRPNTISAEQEPGFAGSDDSNQIAYSAICPRTVASSTAAVLRHPVMCAFRVISAAINDKLRLG